MDAGDELVLNSTVFNKVCMWEAVEDIENWEGSGANEVTVFL